MKLSVVIPVYNQEKLVLRAIKSVPYRKDVEIIVVDDCSTDNTAAVVQKAIDTNPDRNITLLRNEVNKGVGYTLNRGLEVAKGEYLVWLGSDDYFYTQQLETVLELALANGEDLVYYNLRDNKGGIMRPTPETKFILCGSVKLMKRSLIGETRHKELRRSEDYHFFVELQEKKPTERFTNITAKHYNFPRVGSLMWNAHNKKE